MQDDFVFYEFFCDPKSYWYQNISVAHLLLQYALTDHKNLYILFPIFFYGYSIMNFNLIIFN